MKKIMLFLLSQFLVLSISAQLFSGIYPKETDNNAVSDTLPCYKLYPTANMWTFLKLDTRNGRIWQVQWSFESKNRFEAVLSLVSLINTREKEICGRFELYPTTNNYNFVMLDKISGKTYQVQWSTDYDKRAVVPIE